MKRSYKIVALLVFASAAVIVGIAVSESQPPVLIATVENYERCDYSPYFLFDRATVNFENRSESQFDYQVSVEVFTNDVWQAWKDPRPPTCTFGQFFRPHEKDAQDLINVPSGPAKWRMRISLWKFPGPLKMKLDEALQYCRLDRWTSADSAQEFIVESQAFEK